MYDLNKFERRLGRFSDRVDIIVGLEMGGKITSEEAYERIKKLYKKLKKFHKKEKDTSISNDKNM